MPIDVGAYTSASQRARILTESWIATNGYCPQCGCALERAPNNARAHDFSCATCSQKFELKSKREKFGPTLSDGAYAAMIGAIRSSLAPNFFLLSYQLPFAIEQLHILPRRFIVEPIVIKRPPLGPHARRAGWIGCNINLSLVPRSAWVPYIQAGVAQPRDVVFSAWRRTSAFEGIADSVERGWLAVTLALVEKISGPAFRLADLYQFEPLLSTLFPRNHHIRAKLRQQLQRLRDMGLLQFLGRGQYLLSRD